jgi:hypothetical protein
MLESIYSKRKPAVSKSAKGSVREKRVRDSDGKSVRVLSVDANSPTFIDDLTLLFQKNVARLRRRNRDLLKAVEGRRAKK